MRFSRGRSDVDQPSRVSLRRGPVRVAVMSSVLALSVGSLVPSAGAAPAAAKPPRETITLGITIAHEVYAQLYAASVLGYFEKQNLDVKYAVQGFAGLPAALLSGRIDILAPSTPGTNMSLVNQGAPKVKNFYN